MPSFRGRTGPDTQHDNWSYAMDDTTTYSGAPAPARIASADELPAPPARQTPQVSVDHSRAVACYANFCRLSGSPEEVLMDFGLNPQATRNTVQPTVVTQRVVTGWYTAKRLILALRSAIERHEAAFGVLEPDVQKRIRRI